MAYRGVEKITTSKGRILLARKFLAFVVYTNTNNLTLFEIKMEKVNNTKIIAFVLCLSNPMAKARRVT